jgi:hypothetical protein
VSLSFLHRCRAYGAIAMPRLWPWRAANRHKPHRGDIFVEPTEKESEKLRQERHHRTMRPYLKTPTAGGEPKCPRGGDRSFDEIASRVPAHLYSGPSCIKRPLFGEAKSQGVSKRPKRLPEHDNTID